MTTAAQLRIPSFGRRLFPVDKTVVMPAPAAITIGGFPESMIQLKHAKHMGLAAHAIQTTDNEVLTVTLYGVMIAGRDGNGDEMYFTTIMQSGILMILADGAAASGEGFIGSEYAFADAITAGVQTTNGMGEMLNTVFADYGIDAIGLADIPSVMLMTQLGPLIGIIPRVTVVDTNITQYNFLTWGFS